MGVRVTALIAPFLGLWLLAGEASAQSPGDTVRIETAGGKIEGLLVDKLPNGYLVRFGTQTIVIPYPSVKSIEVVAPPPTEPPPEAPATTPPVEPPTEPPTEAPPPEPVAAVPVPATPPPTVVTPPPTPPASPPVVTFTPPPPERSPGLAFLGTMMTATAVISGVAGIILIPVGVGIKNRNKCQDESGSITFDCDYGGGGKFIAGGAAALLIGVALAGGGIPLMIWGSQPADDGADKAATWRPTLDVGPGAARLKWTF